MAILLLLLHYVTHLSLVLCFACTRFSSIDGVHVVCFHFHVQALPEPLLTLGVRTGQQLRQEKSERREG